LRADGAVAGSGFGLTTVPKGLTNVIAISVGGFHSLALNADGTIVAWGAGSTNTSSFPGPSPHGYGQSVVPAWLTNVTAIAAGSFQSVAVVGGGQPFLTSPLVSRFAIYGRTVNLRVSAQGAGP